MVKMVAGLLRRILRATCRPALNSLASDPFRDGARVLSCMVRRYFNLVQKVPAEMGIATLAGSSISR